MQTSTAHPSFATHCWRNSAPLFCLLGSARQRCAGLSKHFHARGDASRTEEGEGGTFGLASRSQRACEKKKTSENRWRAVGPANMDSVQKMTPRSRRPAVKISPHMCFFSLLASSTQVLLRQPASVTVCKRSGELMVCAWSFRRPTNLCNLCSMGFLQHLCDWQETVSHFERPVWRFLRCCRAWLEVGAVGMCFCKVVFQDAACLCWNRTFLA